MTDSVNDTANDTANDITFTRIIHNDYKIDTVCEIIHKCKGMYSWDRPLAFIQKDSNGRVIVFIVGDDLFYVNGNNLTIRRVIKAIGYKDPLCDILDELVVNAPYNIIYIANICESGDGIDSDDYDSE